ncbi:HI1506-related protein [Magnetococcus sp. PR-3]|uniref:HI1506-related protein n=1 Tax=Magnetococcus sp. PR-3 TaxID=3120355 RepID=UPI002FCE23DC
MSHQQIRISCTVAKGFWRGGHHHPNGTQTYPATRFTKGQLAAIQAEPRLMVQILEDKEPDLLGEAVQDLTQVTQAAAVVEQVTAELEAMVAAISELEEAEYNKDGTPSIKALERAIGKDITAEQRDAAWDLYQQRQQGTTGDAE